MYYDNTRVKIDLDAIERNIDRVRQKVGVPILAVIKADAYGHGAVQIARLLQKNVPFLVSVPFWRPWSCGRQDWKPRF